MGRVRKKRFASVAILGLCKLLVLQEALAGQPLEKMSAGLNQPNSTRPASSMQAPAGRLDLRAPSDVFTANLDESVSAGTRNELVEGKFVSRAIGRTSQTVSSLASGHIMSPMETMAHNFQRQGLPLAKLFENKDSLVHLGLNQKGKPGLWVVHKLH